MATELEQILKQLEVLLPKCNLYNGHWLRTWDKTQEELEATRLVARALELLYKQNVSCRVFDGSSAVSIFRDQSTRTRSSFASASALLGLSVLDMDETKSQVAHGETVRETAAMLSFMTEAIGIRDDLFIGEGHKVPPLFIICHYFHISFKKHYHILIPPFILSSLLYDAYSTN